MSRPNPTPSPGGPEAMVPEPARSLGLEGASQLREFLEIDEAEDRLFRKAGAAVPGEERGGFVEAFYDHLLSFSGPARVLTGDAARVASLKQSLQDYVQSLLTAPIDDAYVGNRMRIGMVHVRTGLLPRWYLGSYSRFVSWWLPRFSQGPDGAAVSRAFLKRLLLDSVLAMETYIAARIEDLSRQKDSLDMEVRDRARQLVESERRYEDLVENAPEMIHQADADGGFIGVNRTELARLGYTLDEMRAMRLEEIVPPAYRRGILEHFHRVKTQGTSRIETLFRTKTGQEFPVEIYATAQYDGDGRFLQTRAFVRDLSERKRLEREVLKWERLAAVGSMAAKVAHEIRNPLSAISLNAELLGDEIASLAPEKRREGERLLMTILGEVDRLNAIIEEYLAFARLPRLAMEEVSLQEVFHWLVQLLTQEMERRGIRLVVHLEEGLPTVAGDARQLEQAFLNILRNAEDAMPKGGEVRVTARALPTSVEVTIIDTGIGIPDESLPLIFDPFFTTKDTGTGLGLAFVQQVLREHRGRITCRSRVGKGTEFVIVFPRSGKVPAAAVAGDQREGGE